MYDDRMDLVDFYPEKLGYNSDDMYKESIREYASSYFRYVPYDAIFDEIEHGSRADISQSAMGNGQSNLKDYGPKPIVVNINKAAKQNKNFRIALWTGEHLQVTLMSINVGEDIGLEMHPDTDQFIRIEEGQAIVKMGNSKDNLEFQANVSEEFAIMIPAGAWHNVINTGNKPLKVYSIYAPPQHPHGVVHVTKPASE